MQRKHVFWALNLALGVAGLGWVLHQFGRGAMSVLSTAPSTPLLLAGIAAVLAAIVASAARWWLLLDGLRLRPGFGPLCAFRAASQSLALLLPGGRLGGEPLRAWYAVQRGVSVPAAITTVVLDRTLEIATSLAFVVGFALVLMARDVPGVGPTVVAAIVGAVSLGTGLLVGTRRLRTGGLLAPFLHTLARTRPGIAQHAGAVEQAEHVARQLLGQRLRLVAALALGVVADVLTLVQYACFLAAFGLPSTPFAVVAAVFASGAARTLPVPGAVGTVEAAQVWIFGMLGHPPEIGLAVGLATRVRDLVWAAPGFGYLLLRALRPPADTSDEVAATSDASPAAP